MNKRSLPPKLLLAAASLGSFMVSIHADCAELWSAERKTFSVSKEVVLAEMELEAPTVAVLFVSKKNLISTKDISLELIESAYEKAKSGTAMEPFDTGGAVMLLVIRSKSDEEKAFRLQMDPSGNKILISPVHETGGGYYIQSGYNHVSTDKTLIEKIIKSQ